MKVAIVHYHLNRGGVTQVIINQLTALNDRAADGPRLEVAILYGGRSASWPEAIISGLRSIDVSLHAVSELDYDENRPKTTDLAEQLQATLGQVGFGSHDTVVHVHNHSLGKNSELSRAITALAESGYAMLLQIHDFAEDMRPNQYRRICCDSGDPDFDAVPTKLYPQATHVHYAVLNGRDYWIMCNAGVDKSRLHVLPNAASELGPLHPKESSRDMLERHFGIPRSDRFLVYPVRGIRRKNLGEALLWSAMAGRNTSFGLTLTPLNPVEQKSYLRWRSLAQQLELKWVFELGETREMDLSQILSASDQVLTTSVAEGFGMVFLEAWLAGRTLAGRDLPSITADFVASGMRFPDLQPSLHIPLDWLDVEQIYIDIAAAFQSVIASYGHPRIDDRRLRKELTQLTQNSLFDFAYCPTESQQNVIARVAESPDAQATDGNQSGG